MSCDAPSLYRYNRGLCRCPACTQAHTDYRRNLNANNRRPSMRAEDVKKRLLADDKTDWMKLGACRRPDIGPDVFFAEEGHDSANAYVEARTICCACTVIDECLDYAFRHRIVDGFWGGLSPNGRRKEAKRRRLALRVVA